jgi:dihydrofolate reductase
MRKIIVLSFITIDGVMQAPGRPEEDTENGFEFGGWLAPYGDDVFNKVLKEEMKPADLLLGRKTFDIWENYWPQHEAIWPGVNDVKKYVVSKTKTESTWNNSVFLQSTEDIKQLKNKEGGDIQVWGSANLIQTLLENDLVDELRIKIFPITLGKGKKLFEDGVMPAAFTLTDSVVSSKGVIIANYKRAGEVKTGTVGE